MLLKIIDQNPISRAKMEALCEVEERVQRVERLLNGGKPGELPKPVDNQKLIARLNEINNKLTAIIGQRASVTNLLSKLPELNKYADATYAANVS